MKSRTSIEELAADPTVQEALARMRPARALDAPQLAQEIAGDLRRIPRGATPIQRAASAGARAWVYDPAKIEAFRAKRKATCADPNAKSSAKNRPRRPSGEWLPDPPLSPAEKKLRAQEHERRKKHNLSRGSKARYENPTFRAKVLEQLRLAREIEYARRRMIRQQREEQALQDLATPYPAVRNGQLVSEDSV